MRWGALAGIVVLLALVAVLGSVYALGDALAACVLAFGLGVAVGKTRR